MRTGFKKKRKKERKRKKKKIPQLTPQSFKIRKQNFILKFFKK